MVDNIFLGAIGPAEQAAGILSNNIFVLLLVLMIGLSYGITPLVAGASERGDAAGQASLFRNALFLNLAAAVVCFAMLLAGSGLLGHMRQPPDVVQLAIPFFDVIIFSMLPLTLFFTCKQFCEGLSNTRIALYISVAGNLLNIFLNYALIGGKCGLPAMGYMGSAWASFIARCCMGGAFLFVVFSSRITREATRAFRAARLNLRDLRDLFRIGANSAMQFIFEVASFVVAGLMAGSFGKEQLDAHGIALNLAAFTYMFASGVAGAATIRAGIFSARGDAAGMRAVSRTAVRAVLVVMAVFGMLFWFFSELLPRAFSSDAVICALAAQLLLIAALFQLFDGLQVTVIGILRGFNDVKVPTVITFVGYWLIALPLAWALAFPLGMETFGIWIGLMASLMFVSLAMLWRLHVVLRRASAAGNA